MLTTLSLPDITEIGGVTENEEIFTMRVDSGGTFLDSSGTSIHIPANAFVDENGDPVKGEIQFSYTEYRDLLDFMLSDLPMNVTEGKEQFYMNASGIFKLLAFQGDKPVYLKKGSSIDVNFAMDQPPESADLLRYDKKTEKWSGGGGGYSRQEKKEVYQGPICGGSFVQDGGKHCPTKPCDILNLIVSTASYYASGRHSIYEIMMQKDPYRALETLEFIGLYTDIEKRRKRSLDSTLKRIKREGHSYRLVVTRHNVFRVKFVVTCQASKNNEFDAWRGTRWKFSRNKNPGLYAKLAKTKWSACKIRPDGEYFNFMVTDTSGDKEIKNVRAIPKDRMDREEKATFLNTQYTEYSGKLFTYQQRMDELETAKTEFNSEVVAYRNSLDSLELVRRSFKPIYDELFADSIYCMWYHGFRFMGQDEWNLWFTKWLQYFDTHGEDMQKRVTRIKTSREFLDCDIKLGDYTPDVTRNQFIKPLKIQSLGIYGIASLVKISDTVEVYADYTDSLGNKLEPVIICLTDKTFNGVVRFDGSNRYSPYKFRLSPSTVKSMMAFDSMGRAYLCTADNFEELTLKGKLLKHTFILKKVEKLKDKQDLLKQL